MSVCINYKQRSLTYILQCQILNKCNLTKRAELLTNFTISKSLEISNLVNLQNSEYLLWVLSRWIITGARENCCDIMSSWNASNRAKFNNEINSTSTPLIPILQHCATSYDSVFTSMLNFQNIMKQTGNACGEIWRDDGVYHIVREVQLFPHDSFRNIFLGLGSFLGKYLERVWY